MSNSLVPFTQFDASTVTATGFDNWVAAVGGTGSLFRVQATGAVAGDSVTANAGPVYVLIKSSAPATGDKAKALQLIAGASMDFYINEASKLYICGANADTVRVLRCY